MKFWEYLFWRNEQKGLYVKTINLWRQNESNKVNKAKIILKLYKITSQIIIIQIKLLIINKYVGILNIDNIVLI